MDSNQTTYDPNNTQVGGSHYKSVHGEQHWDRVHRLGLNWFAANVTKYVERYERKNGLQDLEKARHYLDKLITVERQKIEGQKIVAGYGSVMGFTQDAAEPTNSYVDQGRDVRKLDPKR